VRHRLAAHLLGRRQGMIVDDDDLYKARVTRLRFWPDVLCG